MLVLNREINERVMIGKDIEVVVLGIHGKQIRLGFQAPIEISVHREEIFNKIKFNKLKIKITESK